MNETPAAGPPPPGLFESLRSMLATSIELIQNRLELIVVELEEEIHRLAVTLLWSIVGIFAGGLTALLLALTIVIAFWDGHRLLAASLVTAVFALLTAVAVYVVRQRSAERPGLLAATLTELRRDARSLRRKP